MSRAVFRLFALAALAICFAASPSLSKEPKPETAADSKVDRMIDALASRNPAPRIVFTALNNEVPLFARKYDWAERDRVSAAVGTAIKTKSDVFWWQLVDHVDDTRYALTGWNDNFVDMTAENFTVGELCRHIATTDLALPYDRHLHWDERLIFPNFDPQEVFWKHKQDWAGKPLYLIQVVVCRRAIEQMQRATTFLAAHHPDSDYVSHEHTFTAQEKATFDEEVKKEIELLGRTKKAVTSTEIELPGSEETEFSTEAAAMAANCTKVKENGEETVDITDIASGGRGKAGNSLVPGIP